MTTLAATVLIAGGAPARAVTPAVGLGTAASYAILASSTVTNTGPSVITGDIGVTGSSATPASITGFSTVVHDGVKRTGDSAAIQAGSDLDGSYTDAQNRTPVTAAADADLAGRTLVPGIYTASSEMDLNGTVTLDAGGDPAAVFLFQAGSTLITGSGSTVALLNGAQACNVFWQVGSSATLGSTTSFVGTILAQADISLNDAASVQGRLLARTGAVTLINNRITRPTCASTPTSPPSTSTPTSTPSATPVATTAPSPAARPTGRGGSSSGSSDGGDGTKDSGDDRGNESGPGAGTDTDGGSSTDGGSGDGGSGSGVVVPVGRPDTGAAALPASSSLAGPDPRWLWGALALLAGSAAYPVAGLLRRPRHRARHS